MIGLPRRKGGASTGTPGGQAGSGVLSGGTLQKMPKHVAIIMDGNGRWARARGLPRVEGHRAGAKTVRMVVEESRRLGIRYLTLFCFSSENWLRPEAEVSALMSLFLRYLESEANLLIKNQVRLRAIGDMEKLPEAVRTSLENVIARTRAGGELDLILAISYGSRDEIVNAVRQIAEKSRAGILDPQKISAQTVVEHLYAPDVPDPDLLIRTSSELRISNFLLWQLAYSELVISPLLWPEFSKEEYHRCLNEFSGRNRRYGRTAEQVSEECQSDK